MFIYPNMRTASIAKGLKQNAELVPWCAIVGDPKKTKRFVSVEDEEVYAPYVKSDDISSSASDYLVKHLVKGSIESVANVMYDVRNFLHNVPRYFIGEERQLTSILKCVLIQKLRETSLIVSNGMLLKGDHFFPSMLDLQTCASMGTSIVE